MYLQCVAEAHQTSSRIQLPFTDRCRKKITAILHDLTPINWEAFTQDLS